ncbi:MAG: methyltransferase domain-containing protein [Nitrososphaerales archaeon]|nr:methyltransferase domain-containing protein [Nitrososphaerales archaeon]
MSKTHSQYDVNSCYSDYVSSYDSDMTGFEPTGSRMELFSSMGKFGTCVEFCAGTGRNIRHFPRDSKVSLLDINKDMLEVARRRIGGRKNFSIFVGDAFNAPFKDNYFEVGIFTYAFSGMLDPKAALAEMRRVVVPGGKIGIMDFRVGNSSGWKGNFGKYNFRSLLRDMDIISRKTHRRPFLHRNIERFVVAA